MKNYKIHINPKPLSDKDIAQGKNFNQLLQSYHAAKTPLLKTPKFWWSASAVLVSGVAALLIIVKMGFISKSSTPFINPPITAADIKTITYLIDANSDSTITYASGTKIHVPVNAFKDKNGKIVGGKVELHYREFSDIADVFLAGIPMSYDSAGQQFQFETAGMMQISASQNGNPLQANAEAPIKVDMVSSDRADRFNTYYLDTIEKKWKYLNQSNYKAAPVANPYVASDLSSNGGGGNISTKLEAVKKEITKIAAQKPIAPKKSDDAKPRFSIKADPKEFPEIAMYQNVKFQVEDKDYNPEKANVVWEDIELKRIPNTEKYLVTFIRRDEKYSVVAVPVVPGNDYATAKEIYDQKFKAYENALAQKKADETKLKAELEVRAKEQKAQIEKENEEQAASIKKQSEFNRQTNLFYRTFNVSYFGIYNCDHPGIYPEGAVVAMVLNDAKTNQPLKIRYCYLVEKDKKAMFGYDQNTLNNFRYNPAKENMVWVLTDDLQLAVAKPEQFKAAAIKGNEMDLQLNVIDKKFTTTEEVKEYLQI